MQEHDIEQVQKRSLQAILSYKSYAKCLELSNFTTLSERQVQLCIDLSQKIKDNCTNPLHCIFHAEKGDRVITSDTPNIELFERVLNKLMEVFLTMQSKHVSS